MKKVVKLMLLTAIVFGVWSFTKVENKLEDGYKVGDVVSDFKLENIDGKMVSMASFNEAKGFIITFTCNTCPYAVAYEDRVEALNKMYAEKGYPVIAIMPNSVKAKPEDGMKYMQERAKEKGFTFPYLMDKGQRVYPQFGATKTPHIYVVEKTDKGNVVKYVGAIDDNFQNADEVKHKYVEDAVNALLNGKAIDVTETKAIGCSIKV
ncbi:thioredoxin family protein [Lacinutrix sp.]|uniref:thioredoxin family protein n=1 Tax=Lacinutrix sp. TaxID=1937692 RepID=UPI0025BA965B|nr:thioredoxin family protein [Lacinutrix sp.]